MAGTGKRVVFTTSLQLPTGDYAELLYMQKFQVGGGHMAPMKGNRGRGKVMVNLVCLGSAVYIPNARFQYKSNFTF